MNNNEIMNMVVNEIQEKTRVNNLKTAHEIYKKMKNEIIQSLLNRMEKAIVEAMLEGYASTSVNLTKIEFSHGEELANYFRKKGFNAYCDRFYNEDGKEYLIFIEWAVSELNLQ